MTLALLGRRGKVGASIARESSHEHSCRFAQDATLFQLQDAVRDGASIGFVEVPSQLEAEAYWQSVLEAVRNGSKVLLIAENESRVMGSVHLGLVSWDNGSHRAEVMKLLVHTSARRQVVGF